MRLTFNTSSVKSAFSRDRNAASRKQRARRPYVEDVLEQRNLLSTVTVPGNANIYGAGIATAPAPGGGGGGVLPVQVLLSGLGKPNVLDFPTVSGTVTARTPTGLYNGPDGGSYFGGRTNLNAVGGISGIQDSNATMFLVGVFLGPNGQPATAPATLDVSNANSTASFSPLLGQQFFIGDGRTTGGVLQTVVVPSGATQLDLGFADGYQFGYPNPQPGYYGDDGGSLTVDVERAVQIDVNGVSDAQRASLGGLVVMSFDNNNAPRAEITIQPSPLNLLLTENNSEVSIFTTATGGSPLTFNGIDNLFPKNGPIEHLYVQGSKYSNTMRDVKLTLTTKGPVQGSDAVTFTVLWVDQPIVATSGTVSANNSAINNYISWTEAGTDQLGPQLYKNQVVGGTSVGRMGWGTEARATVHPSDFNYPDINLMLQRDNAFHDWNGNGVSTIDQRSFGSAGPIPAANDSGDATDQDNNPSTSNGIIYDFDAPGLYITTAPKGAVQRTRNNFASFATITINHKLVRTSMVTYYFVDFSMKQIDGPQGANWVVISPPDVKGDKQAGNGTKKLTWNLT